MRQKELWLAVNKDGSEIAHEFRSGLHRSKNLPCWDSYDDSGFVELPKGTIKKLTGRELTWEDEPVCLTEDML